jgi:hypothetical protein
MPAIRTLAVCAVAATLVGCQNMPSSDGGAAGGAAAPAAAPSVQGQQRFLCCNVRTEREWLSDGNFYVGRLIPAGTPVTITGTPGRDRVSVQIDGAAYRIGQEYGRKEEPFDRYMNKVLLTSDPRPKINSFAPPVRDAIRQGKLVKGMTKEQVLMSLGHPPTHGTASLESNEWKYWYNRFATYLVLFDPQGRVRDIVADQGMRYMLFGQQ